METRRCARRCAVWPGYFLTSLKGELRRRSTAEQARALEGKLTEIGTRTGAGWGCLTGRTSLMENWISAFLQAAKITTFIPALPKRLCSGTAGRRILRPGCRRPCGASPRGAARPPHCPRPSLILCAEGLMSRAGAG